MKSLKDYEEDINKCSKCGLCQSVCPVYKITGNDCAVSRGKFIMLKGILDGDLKLNKNVNKYLDLCLKCGKCTDFCPSGIDVVKIFECAKSEYFKKSFSSKIIKFLQSKLVFGNLINIGKFFREFCHPEFISGSNKAKILKQVQNDGFSPTKLLYFKGCVNEIYPKCETALKKVLSHYDVELIEKPFECCGMPFLSSGNMERYEEVKKRNLELIDCDYDYILTDCASCEDTLKSYFDPSPALRHPLPQGAGGEIINALDFLAAQNIKFVFKSPVKVTFHKPCHLENTDLLKPLFDKCKNVEYIEMNEWDECCGFAGEFALKNNKISRQIGAKKAQNILDTDADYVLTTCPACIMGLYQGFLALGKTNKKAPKILNLIEFLALADKII